MSWQPAKQPRSLPPLLAVHFADARAPWAVVCGRQRELSVRDGNRAVERLTRLGYFVREDEDRPEGCRVVWLMRG